MQHAEHHAIPDTVRQHAEERWLQALMATTGRSASQMAVIAEKMEAGVFSKSNGLEDYLAKTTEKIAAAMNRLAEAAAQAQRHSLQQMQQIPEDRHSVQQHNNNLGSVSAHQQHEVDQQMAQQQQQQQQQQQGVHVVNYQQPTTHWVQLDDNNHRVHIQPLDVNTARVYVVDAQSSQVAPEPLGVTMRNSSGQQLPVLANNFIVTWIDSYELLVNGQVHVRLDHQRQQVLTASAGAASGVMEG